MPMARNKPIAIGLSVTFITTALKPIPEKDENLESVSAKGHRGGLRLMECIPLRIRDLDFDHRLIYVRTANAAETVSPIFR